VVRAGDADEPGDEPEQPLPRTEPTVTLDLIRGAAKDQAAVWIGYVNADGHASQRVIEPLTVEGGYVRAFDHLREEVRTFALHRITGAATIAPD
jgi:predicted DNA-binding transcriptional regulator YafY